MVLHITSHRGPWDRRIFPKNVVISPCTPCKIFHSFHWHDRACSSRSTTSRSSCTNGLQCVRVFLGTHCSYVNCNAKWDWGRFATSESFFSLSHFTRFKHQSSCNTPRSQAHAYRNLKTTVRLIKLTLSARGLRSLTVSMYDQDLKASESLQPHNIDELHIYHEKAAGRLVIDPRCIFIPCTNYLVAYRATERLTSSSGRQ